MINSTQEPQLLASHTHGEADIASYNFAMHLAECTIVLEAGDTDWFFYGLALLEASPTLKAKTMLVHHRSGRSTASVHEFYHLNAIYEMTCLKLQKMGVNMQQPAAQLLFTYLLSGTDYIPGFKHVIFMNWGQLLLQEHSFITQQTVQQEPQPQQQQDPAHEAAQEADSSPIVQLQVDGGHATSVQFSQDSATRLISARYYASANSKGELCSWPMAQVYEELTTRSAPDRHVTDTLEQWYRTGSLPSWPASMSVWLEVVHRFSFIREGNDDRTIPPPTAVIKQIERCIYVISLVYEAVLPPSNIKQQHLQHGWRLAPDGSLMVDWGGQVQDPHPASDTRTASRAHDSRSNPATTQMRRTTRTANRDAQQQTGCKCTTGCSSARCGCRAAGLPCNARCSCRHNGTCINPYNAAASDDDMQDESTRGYVQGDNPATGATVMRRSQRNRSKSVRYRSGVATSDTSSNGEARDDVDSRGSDDSQNDYSSELSSVLEIDSNLSDSQDASAASDSDES